ncbi:MAG: pyridoxamine 5'-phosphate oxidase family protein [Acidimicrobiales bacterium]
MSDDALDPTGRTNIRRHTDRGVYERDQINAILDEGLICHVACHVDGTTWMIPTAYGRRGHELLLHGAAANHVLKAASAGAALTVTVTLVDAMVLTRATFNHSINYRSVVVFGQATAITDPDAKAAALGVIVDHLLPGRSCECRWPTPTELAKTRVVALPITEASAKVRDGPPVDDESDRDAPVWSGLIPLATVAGPAVDAADMTAGTAPSPQWLAQSRWVPHA